MKRNISSILLPLGLALGVIGGIFIGKYEAVRHLSPQQEKMQTILGLIRNQYVDDVDVDSLLEASIPDLLASLDPHSAYIPKSELTATNEELEGSFGGIGVTFQILVDTVRVIEVVPGGPAEMVGMQPGDMILKANDFSLHGDSVNTNTVFKHLRGPQGSKVTLTVKRRGTSKPITFDITRDKIPEKSVDSYYLINDSIAYLRVSKFARTTYNEFIAAMLDLKKQGASKFVLDFRGNSGGFMDQAISMVNEFLPAGKIIVYTKGRLPENENMFISDGAGQFQDVELTVLTNEFSASASEIFAGAIQDNDRGLVIGRRTFGKGLVQNPIMLPDSSGMRLTVARYYTPSGRCIQKEYKRGLDGKYNLDILDRFNHGEFYSKDSVKLDESKKFTTVAGRTVYGGGGIMPDIFVPEDTTGYTSYFVEAQNRGLIQRYAGDFAEKYRPLLKKKSMEELNRILPRDNMLLNNFVNYAAENGLPARWFYINRSRDLLLNQLKAVIARDLIDFNSFIEILNQKDVTIDRAIKALESGEAAEIGNDKMISSLLESDRFSIAQSTFSKDLKTLRVAKINLI